MSTLLGEQKNMALLGINYEQSWGLDFLELAFEFVMDLGKGKRV